MNQTYKYCSIIHVIIKNVHTINSINKGEETINNEQNHLNMMSEEYNFNSII